MYKKIGVVGDKDSVLAFKALGVDVAPVVGADEARRAVDKMAMNDYAVIFGYRTSCCNNRRNY